MMMMMNNGRVFLKRINLVLLVYTFSSLMHATDPLDPIQIQINQPAECNVALYQGGNVSPLGKNLAARFGSWASLGLCAAMGSFLTYKSFEQVFDNGLSYIPFLRSYHQETAKIAGFILALPVSIAALMQCGSLSHYFFYILYSGERVSPLLARDALHDVRVYVEHLQTIKNVQKELNEVIEKINALSMQKKNDTQGAIDRALVFQLDNALKRDDKYLKAVVTQLHLFLSKEELDVYMKEIFRYEYSEYVKGYCIAPELEGTTQAIIAQLQSTVQNLGDDALVLNKLMKGLVDYWQNYTAALAMGIDAALQFCNSVYILEQIITQWFNRPLLCA